MSPKTLRRYCLITLACAIYAVAFDWCYAPNNIAYGGFTGVAQMIHAFLGFPSIGVLVFSMNVPLFLVGWKLLGGSLLVSSLYAMTVSSLFIDLLARLYSSQLITRGDKHLLDHNRTYYKLLRQIVLQGQERGELRGDVTVNEMVRVYALCERALIYDWCLSGGDYSLLQYGRTMMPMFFQGFRSHS